jgi:hypothetical protein
MFHRTARARVLADAADDALRPGIPINAGVFLQRSRADVASNNGGHKTVRLAKKKGGSSEFYCFVTFFFFETKQIKFLRVLAPFFSGF